MSACLASPSAPAYIPVRTPACDGLHMPAEWEPHTACWMSWPVRAGALTDLGLLQQATAEVAAAVARFEPVKMLVSPEWAEEAESRCGSGVEIIPQACLDPWIRDSGPTFVVDGRGGVAGIDWMFNAWGHFSMDKTLLGQRDAASPYDIELALLLLHRENMRRYAAPFVLEGGAFHVDGEGTLLVTEQCQLDPVRNPTLGKSHLEELYRAYLGVEKIIWLGDGLEDDCTKGHVDIIACFAAPGKVLLHHCSDPADPNFAITRDALHRLQNATDARGRTLEIIFLPQPQKKVIGDWRLDLTYINFYLPNGGLVMSTFDDPADEEARAILAGVFPDREIVQVPGYGLFQAGGGIHCITQQQPVGNGLSAF